MKTFLPVIAALTALSIAACATSPTGRKQLLLVPDSQMNQMGVQAFDQMKAQTPVSNDPKYNAFVQCISKPLIAAGQDKLDVKDWEIVVFKDDTANAFALPGGKIGVHTGILPVAKSDAQLAAVIGHEIGHVMAKHGAERTSQTLAAQGGLGVAGAVIGGGGDTKSQALMAALGLGTQVGLLLPFGRTQESEADEIGLDLMARAGFDPRQSVELWKNMMAAGGGSPPEFLSTHPSNERRIDDLNAHMADAMRQYEAARTAGRAPSCAHP